MDFRGDHLQTVALPPYTATPCLRRGFCLFFSGRRCRTMPNCNCSPPPATDGSEVLEDNCNHLDRSFYHDCAVANCLQATFGEWRKFLDKWQKKVFLINFLIKNACITCLFVNFVFDCSLYYWNVARDVDGSSLLFRRSIAALLLRSSLHYCRELRVWRS